MQAGPDAPDDGKQLAAGFRLANGEPAVDLSGFDPGDPVRRTGPPDLDGPDLRIPAQTEMQGRRSLGQIGAAETDLLDLPTPARMHRDPGTDGERVRMPALEIDRQPAIVRPEDIAVDRRRRVVVGDQDVDPAVAVIVGADRAPALARVADAQFGRALGEGAVSVRHEQPGGIVEERGVLPVPSDIFLLQPVSVRLGPGHAVAIGVEEVDMAVIVEIGETRPPAPAALPDAGGVRRILEPAVAAISVEPVAGRAFSGPAIRVVDAGHEPVHVAVAVVVPNRGAHAVLVGDDGIADVSEAPAAFVQQHLAGPEIARQQDVRVAVAVNVAEGRREGHFERRRQARLPQFTDRRHMGDVLEPPLPVIAPEIVERRVQSVRELPPLGEKEVQVAVAVVIACGHRIQIAHVGACGKRAGLLREAPAAVIAERLRAAPVEGEEIRRSVLVEVNEIPGPVRGGRIDAAIAGTLREAPPVPGKQPAGLASPMGDIEFKPAVAVDIDKGQAAIHQAGAGVFLAVRFDRTHRIGQTDRLGNVDEAAARSRGGCGLDRGDRTGLDHRDHRCNSERGTHEPRHCVRLRP